MMRVKICGVCTPADALLATSAGADCVGVILAPGFRRTRSLDDAGAIFAQAGTATRVGVFVDAASHDVMHAVEMLGLGAVQLHGDEPAAALDVLYGRGFEVWKAVRVRDVATVTGAAARYAGVADLLLLDGWHPQVHGGTGARFDWAAVAAMRDTLPATLRIGAAGGLDPDNVGDVVRRLHPVLVDVSSGVERSPCSKDAGLVHAFIAAARGAEDTQ